jgi:hypothetical protein
MTGTKPKSIFSEWFGLKLTESGTADHAALIGARYLLLDGLVLARLQHSKLEGALGNA